MRTTYPNLELIEYKANQLLTNDSDVHTKILARNLTIAGNRRGSIKFEFDMVVFSQTWGNTCTGFDVCSDGSPAFGGDAMTKEYTTVVHELMTDSYLVFFGNRPCYKVTNPTEAFYEDLKVHRMASLSESKKRY